MSALRAFVTEPARSRRRLFILLVNNPRGFPLKRGASAAAHAVWSAFFKQKNGSKQKKETVGAESSPRWQAMSRRLGECTSDVHFFAPK